jgi:O-methyltransferase
MNINLFKNLVEPYTMTSIQRIESLYHSLEYIRLNKIEGDFVECGVWKGGNIFGVLEYLIYYGLDNRKIWMYDTFQGMTQISDFDVDFNGVSGKIWENKCDCSLQEVKKLMDKSSYNKSLINYVEGDVCNTLSIKKNIPEKISLLRLDTDWYDSTKKELQILYPRLVSGGVLIVDDYGHWQGSKKAVDEYFENNKIVIEKIDYTAIKIIKI